MLLLHAVGTGMILAWVAVQLTRIRRWVSQSHPVTDQALLGLVKLLAQNLNLKKIPSVRLSEPVPGPIALGLLRTVILLPAAATGRLPEAELKTILAHELAHVRRGDLWVNWLQILLQAVWWFHPVLWPLNRMIRRVREECCDDLLLARRLTSNEARVRNIRHASNCLSAWCS